MGEKRRNELRKFYERLGEVCAANGFEPYLPHKVSDPKLNATMLPKDVDQLDRTAVMNSYFVVAYVGQASLGVGIEVEMAYHAHKPVILLFEKQALDDRRVSRLARGNPAVVAEVVFSDFPDAEQQLATMLPKFVANLRERFPALLQP